MKAPFKTTFPGSSPPLCNPDVTVGSGRGDVEVDVFVLYINVLHMEVSPEGPG